MLASIGSLGVLLPAFPVLAVLFVARRPQAGPFGVGLFFGIGIGLAAGLVLARAYLASVSAQLHLIGLCAAGFGVVTALMAPLAFPACRAGCGASCAAGCASSGSTAKQVVLPSLGIVRAVAGPGAAGARARRAGRSGRTCRPSAGRPTRP